MILRMEAIQRLETKIIKRLKHYSYGERLEKLEWTTLLERKMRDEQITIFKIINGISN